MTPNKKKRKEKSSIIKSRDKSNQSESQYTILQNQLVEIQITH